MAVKERAKKQKEIKAIPFFPHEKFEVKPPQPWEKFSKENAPDFHLPHATDKHHNKSGWRHY